MRRFLIALSAFLLVLLVLAAGFAYWAIHDDSFLKDRIAAIVLEQTGRELTVDGPLEVRPGRQTVVLASRVTLENAPWGENDSMLRIGHLRLAIDIPGLFGDRVQLDALTVQDCLVELRSNAEGVSNWDIFPQGEEDDRTEETGPSVALMKLDLQRCELSVDGPRFEQEVVMRITQAWLRPLPGDRVEGMVEGQVNEDPLDFDGWVGPLSAFSEGGLLEHELRFTSGEITLESAGSIADTTDWSGPDLRARFSGPEIRTVLTRLGLPDFSTGAFDFNASLRGEGELSHLEVDGDLGSLNLDVVGRFDRLKAPSRGELRANASGPDLAALAAAFGASGLVAAPFDARLALRFDGPAVVVEDAGVSTDHDRLDLSGLISTRTDAAGSTLDVEFASDSVDRWLAPHTEMAGAVGPASLQGKLATDDSGTVLIDARIEALAAGLTVRGSLGAWAGPLAPDLLIDFQTDHPPVAGAALGVEGLPDTPLVVSGPLRLEDTRISSEGLQIRLGPHTAELAGVVTTGDSLQGSRAEGVLDTPDLAALGRLFGVEDLPAERLRLEGAADAEDEGLRFRVDRAEVGAARLRLEGRIADLDKPAGIDLDFDLGLPGLSAIARWLPERPWPDGEVTVRGSLVNRDERVDISEAVLTLGEDEARLQGAVVLEDAPRLDGLLTARVTDLSRWQETAEWPLPGLPLDLSVRIDGTAQALSLRQIDLRTGASRLQGDITVDRDEPTRISGELRAPLLDLTPWLVGEEESPEAKPRADKRRYVFDETEIAGLGELGVEIDLDLEVEQALWRSAEYLDLTADLLIRDRRLEIRPFDLRGSGGGRFSGFVQLDERGDSPALEIDLKADRLSLALGALEGQDPATLPRADLDLALRGTGRTHREMAESLDGEVRLRVGPGQLASSNYAFLFNDFLVELLNTLNPFYKAQKVTEFECAVAAADIASGQVDIAPVVVQVKRLTIISKGTIDLETEALDITFNSKQRTGMGLSASDLVNPFIKVGGTMASPMIKLDPEGTVVKGGLAVATAGLSILANSLAERFLSSKDPCGDALELIEKRDRESP